MNNAGRPDSATVECSETFTTGCQGPIPVDEALPIAKQIAEALEAAHEQRIILIQA